MGDQEVDQSTQSLELRDDTIEIALDYSPRHPHRRSRCNESTAISTRYSPCEERYCVGAHARASVAATPRSRTRLQGEIQDGGVALELLLLARAKVELIFVSHGAALELELVRVCCGSRLVAGFLLSRCEYACERECV